MKSIIHINRQAIQKNAKNNTNEPVITCKTYKSNDYAREVIIYGQDGKEAARIVYSPDKPLSCGAKVWIETTNEIKIVK